jgi:ABC-type sugar transport system, periplasmic component
MTSFKYLIDVGRSRLIRVNIEGSGVVYEVIEVNWKRVPAALSAAFVGVLGLAACGNQSESSDNAASGGDKQVTITVFDVFASEDPQSKYVYEYADAFMEQNPNVKVEITAIAVNDVFTKLAAMATDPSSVPTLYYTSGDQVPSLFALGFTEDLTSHIDEDVASNFGTGVLEAARLDEAISFYPLAVQPLGILYRSDHYAAEGLKEPTTWEEFLANAKALTGKNEEGNDRAGFSMVGSNNSSGQSRFLSYLWSNCLNVVAQDADGNWTTDADSPEFLKAFSFWTAMNEPEKVVPTGITSVDYPTAANYFSMGLADMMMTGPNALGIAYAANPDLEGNVGSFPIPGSCPATQLTAEGFALSAHASDDEKKAAMDYLNFFASNDPELMFWQSSGKIPATVSGQEAEFLQGDDYAGYLKTIADGNTVPTINFPGMAAVKTAVGDAYSAVFSGEATNEEAVEALKKEIDQIIEENK